MIAFAGFSRDITDSDKISFEDLASVGLRIVGHETNHGEGILFLFIKIFRNETLSILFKNPPEHVVDEVIDERISGEVLRLILALLMLDSDLEQM